ncbi:MAG: glycosyltransferase family 4 protein [Acidobacteriia bacterium]|nr:glycosyltransferase family 4 protein [Terriglobia bacterium]
MRILHLDSGREMRGGQWQVLRLIEGLAAEGVESTLLARRDGPLFTAARQRGCSVAPLSLARVLLLARGHGLVHAHDSRSHTLAALVPGARLVVARRVAFGGVGRWPARLKYDRPAKFIAVSEFARQTLLARGIPASKIEVVYDGVPLLAPAQGAAVVAPAHEADPRKGSPLALEAARLAGVPLAFSTDLEQDLRHAAVFVYITHSEGLGSGALLAMSAGVPVVASKVGGLPEIVRHRETGLLVDNTPQAIAAAIRELLDDAPLARRLGAAARQTVAERFTVGHMVRRTMEVYRQVLS